MAHGQELVNATFHVRKQRIRLKNKRSGRLLQLLPAVLLWAGPGLISCLAVQPPKVDPLNPEHFVRCSQRTRLQVRHQRPTTAIRRPWASAFRLLADNSRDSFRKRD